MNERSFKVNRLLDDYSIVIEQICAQDRILDEDTKKRLADLIESVYGDISDMEEVESE